MNDDFKNLQLAVQLQTHEEAVQAFKEIENLNARYLGKFNNILHYMIRTFDQDDLRVSDFEKLVELNVDVNCKGNEGQTPLHYTANFPNFKLAKILVDHGADVNAQDNYGNSILSTAVANYSGEKDLLKIIHLLLLSGADINKENKYGVSAKSLILLQKNNVAAGRALKESDLSQDLQNYL